METEQQRYEQERKDNRLKRITDAIMTGQSIASNMLTIADKRGELKKKQSEAEGRQEVIDILNEPLVGSNFDEPSLDPKANQQMFEMAKADRYKRLVAAYTKGDFPESSKAFFDQQFDKSNSADTEIRSLFDPNTNQVSDFIINKKNPQVLTISGTPVSKEKADKLLRGYAPFVVETGSGEMVAVSKVAGRTGTTKDTPIPKEKIGTVTNLVQLPKRDRDKVVQQISEAKSDSLITEGRKALKPLQLMRKAVENGDKATIDRMGGLFHKAITADVGNLATYEQRNPSSAELWEKLKNTGSLWAKGEPSEAMKQEIYNSLNSAEETINQTLNDSLDFKAESIIEQYPQMNKEAVLKMMGASALQPKVDAFKDMEDIKKATPEQLKKRLEELEKEKAKSKTGTK